MGKYVLIWLSIVMICIASCKKDEILRGFDQEALFRTPDSREIEAIQASFYQRNLVPSDVNVEESHKINERLVLKMISFQLQGYKQYAAILLPASNKPLPVQLYINGFGLNEPVSYANIKTSSSDTASLPFVYVVPSLKGQSLSLTVNGIAYKSPQSGGTRNDAFDGATDDAIACLNAVAIAFSGADTSKVMVRGGSRGGTVALLMAERDKRVKRVAGVAFPADLLGLTRTHENDPTYGFQFLDALVNGKSTLEETRIKMIASSPLYFCSQLPKTQMHFGVNDKITPAAQGEMLVNAMTTLGMSNNIKLFLYPGREHADIGDNNVEMDQRIHAFFSEIF